MLKLVKEILKKMWFQLLCLLGLFIWTGAAYSNFKDANVAGVVFSGVNMLAVVIMMVGDAISDRLMAIQRTVESGPVNVTVKNVSIVKPEEQNPTKVTT